ncbi:protein FAM200A-like [Oratosquilla oratoria]|uniref:protein FAM200A-like n=1 Tax=Oratosquilla oratoria TaxID=337810 RepID=UPI003F76322C
MFPQLTEFLDINKLSVELVRNQIYGHLTALSEHFNSYFTDIDTDAWDWVRDPFVASSSARGLSAKVEEELLELSCDGSQRIRFRQCAHIDFWASIKEEYPELFAAASKVLLPFPTTYLCEASLSALTAMKTKYRARMHVEDDLRFENPCSNALVSHDDTLLVPRPPENVEDMMNFHQESRKVVTMKK